MVLVKPNEFSDKPKVIKYQRELPETKMEIEFLRKVAIECGKRCMMHRLPRESEIATNPALASALPSTDKDELIPDYSRIKVSPSEQLCLNRCISKINNVRELVDNKVLIVSELESGTIQLETPPILYN